MLEEEEVIAG